jgi:lipopolysaccharide transport system permease protein/teichoic acid transport system permease protein
MFLQPLIFIFILYFVFTLGFNSEDAKGEIPFSLYLVTGMISWQFFSGALSSITHVIESHSFLVNKIDFRLSVLPVVKILSALVTHLVLLTVAIGLCWYEGYAPTFFTLQVLYYLIAMLALLLGLGWLTSSTNIFVRDVSKIVGVIIQFGFWLTPIFWKINRFPDQYQWLFKLNPIYYIVTGYRDSLITQTAFWSKPKDTLYYWVIAMLLMYIGISVFRKLRPHFAEVI